MSWPELVILDRDGVLNVDSGYVFRAEEWRFAPGAIEAIHDMQTRGIRVAIASNQSGIARGFGTPEDFQLLMEWAQCALAGADAILDAVFVCFDHPEGRVVQFRGASERRKPGPGMLLEALNRFTVASEDALFVGDREDDARAGAAAGVRTVLVVPSEPLLPQIARACE